jgi:hypothetical protein
MKPRITEHTTYDDLPAMMTAEEVSIYLNRSYKALLTALEKGKAPFSAKKVGFQYRISKTQFQDKPLQTFKN